MQLVAYGAQDVYLTGNPQITFFKIVYRRHTNFSTEVIPQFFTHRPDFGKRVTCIIGRSGDLIGKMHLVVTLPRIPQFKTTQRRIYPVIYTPGLWFRGDRDRRAPENTPVSRRLAGRLSRIPYIR